MPRRAHSSFLLIMQNVEGRAYRCTGIFYDWRDNLADFDKRAVLDIRSDDGPDALHADAVIVMMNPGSSAPLPGFGGRASAGVAVPTKPDAVQYQVMRLMGSTGWRWVRVLNLADVRAARSADLYARMGGEIDPADLGAMFANASCLPLAQALVSRRVICAWGMDKRLAPLARPAHDWLTAQGIQPLGVRGQATFPAYRYPKPVGNWQMAVEWLSLVRAQVAAAPPA